MVYTNWNKLYHSIIEILEILWCDFGNYYKRLPMLFSVTETEYYRECVSRDIGRALIGSIDLDCYLSLCSAHPIFLFTWI